MESVQLFTEKSPKTETKPSGAESRPSVRLPYLGTDVSLVFVTMLCRLVRPKTSRIHADWTQ